MDYRKKIEEVNKEDDHEVRQELQQDLMDEVIDELDLETSFIAMIYDEDHERSKCEESPTGFHIYNPGYKEGMNACCVCGTEVGQ